MKTLQNPTLEKAQYEVFLAKFSNKEFGTQRLGQAFYNHFNLHKVTDQDSFGLLYELDGEVAKAQIRKIFTIQ